MNLLALLGTVWLFTTPAFGRLGHDTIGFLGASVCAIPDGATECLIGQDDEGAGSYPAVGLQYAQPIDGQSTEAIVVETLLYCEVFVIQRQHAKRMSGVAVFLTPDCSAVLIQHRFRWSARQLAR